LFVQYYKLAEQPFGVTPDPRFLFLTATHREALASIVYAVMENRGFSALVAPPGMGKTTLLFELLQRCGDSVRTIFLFQFQPTPEGLLRNLLSELGEPDGGLNFEAMQEKLNQLILEESKKGKRIVVVVDEAQNFREPVLEVLRMLSNFETSQDKLIHIILSGQPQLAEMLFSAAIEQLRQRISIMAVLRPLSAEEARDYIEHRLRTAGYRGTRSLFTSAACERIAQYSGGIPRNINNLCFNALSLGYALKRASIGPELVEEAFRDLTLTNGAGMPPQGWQASATENHHRPGPLPAVGMSAVWPPPQQQSSGRGLRLTAGVASFAAALCVGGIFVKQYASPPQPINISLPVPAPPVPQVEITTEAPVAAQPIPETVQAHPEPVPALVKDSRPAPRPRPPEREQVRVKLVRVSQRETLYELCAKNLDACDGRAIKEIQRLNPWLHDVTQLEAGEAVRLPLEAPGRRSHFSPSATTKSGDKR